VLNAATFGWLMLLLGLRLVALQVATIYFWGAFDRS